METDGWTSGQMGEGREGVVNGVLWRRLGTCPGHGERRARSATRWKGRPPGRAVERIFARGAGEARRHGAGCWALKLGADGVSCLILEFAGVLILHAHGLRQRAKTQRVDKPAHGREHLRGHTGAAVGRESRDGTSGLEEGAKIGRTTRREEAEGGDRTGPGAAMAAGWGGRTTA